MKLIWVSVRKASDLCSTTTYALLEGLRLRGHEVVFLSPEPFDETTPWANVSLEQSSVKGFHARSLATSALNWFNSLQPQDDQCVVVDWPLARKLGPQLSQAGHRILLMDRSPPADPGIFGKLQWREWKKAWRLVDEGIFDQGFVVSQPHARFVRKYCKRNDCVHILPAGVDTELFQPAPHAPDLSAPSFVYHGRLDKHRGVLALPLLIQRLRASGKNGTLTLIGEGDALQNLENIARSNPWISVIQTLKQGDLACQLAHHDIGLLPMPDSTVWRLASPLKRSEYISCGLMVYGIKHTGNQFSEDAEDWMKLVDRDMFHDACEPWIESLMKTNITEMKHDVRTYALENLDWRITIDAMEKILIMD